MVQLRAEIVGLKTERDYFRGRCELLEMRLGTRPGAISVKRDWREGTPKPVVPQGAKEVGTRKSWAQLQAINTAEIAAEIAAKQKKIEEQPEATPSN